MGKTYRNDSQFSPKIKRNDRVKKTKKIKSTVNKPNKNPTIIQVDEEIE